jgi:NADPH:quinone reductase-like Zn-dependent oxidoreductase
VGGHIALIGVLTGVRGDVPTALLMRKQQRLQGILVGSRRHQIDFVRALEVTKLKPVIDASFPLKKIADAFRLQQAGGHFGKIVLEF